MEDSYLKADQALNERCNGMALEIGKISDMLAADRNKNNATVDRLEKRISDANIAADEKVQRCGKSLQQQIEYVSKLIMTRQSGMG